MGFFENIETFFLVTNSISNQLFRMTPEIFLALSLLIFFKVIRSCRAIEGEARSGLPRAYFRKRYSEKNVSAFHLRDFASLNPAVFSA
jgi:hypothetical protein